MPEGPATFAFVTRRTLNRISGLIVALGAAAVLAIFLTAAPDEGDALRDDPLGRKKYAHEMKVIGGKANLLAADLQDDFLELWHGRALAGTVIVLTGIATLTFRFIVTLPSGRPAPAKASHPVQR